jgi:hypothetical protein
MIKKLEIKMDINGNKALKISFDDRRGFSIQTNGNLPVTHDKGINYFTLAEISTYLSKCGTKNQIAAFGKGMNK